MMQEDSESLIDAILDVVGQDRIVGHNERSFAVLLENNLNSVLESEEGVASRSWIGVRA